MLKWLLRDSRLATSQTLIRSCVCNTRYESVSPIQNFSASSSVLLPSAAQTTQYTFLFYPLFLNVNPIF